VSADSVEEIDDMGEPICAECGYPADAPSDCPEDHPVAPPAVAEFDRARAQRGES
jgi:hypothetical protein